MESSIARDDSAHAVLSHQRNGVRVMHDISSEFGHLLKQMFQDIRLPTLRGEQAKSMP